MRALLLALVLTLWVATFRPCSAAATAPSKEDGKALLDNIQKYSNCVVQSSFSFLNSSSFPPKSESELKTLCKSQAEGFKCVKEKTRGALPLIRRGLVTYVTSRAKHHKKYCTNTASEQSRKFVEATKCLMEHNFQAYRNNDNELVQSLAEIIRRNYNDSAAELKQICCIFHDFRNNFLTRLGPECAVHKQMIEELAGEVASDDLELVCDDDEKLAKLCPKLGPLQIRRAANFQQNARLPASSMALYLLATLGEPNESLAVNALRRR